MVVILYSSLARFPG